jgi:predicted Zn-dependent peptidase
MLHAKVENKGIETQREVVKEERRQSVDNQPYGSILEEIVSRAFTKHPYRWSVIGSMDHLNAAQEEDYVNFYKQFYVPNNAILSIAGDFDKAEIKKQINQYFGTIPKNKAPIYRPNIVEPPLKGEIRDTVYDNIQLPAVIQAYRTPAQGTDDYYAVSMLSTLLSQGESSRMYRALVDEQQKALAAQAIPLPTEDPGLSIVLGIANVGVDVNGLEMAINEEISKVQKDLISEDEFQKLRNQIESNFINSNSTVAGIAESLANYEMYYGNADLINKELDRFMSVTREDIRNAAKKFFSKDNRVVLHYLPMAAKP